MSKTPLADVYCAHADASSTRTADERETLDCELQEVCERAEAAWPGVVLPRAEFVAKLAAGASDVLTRTGALEEVYLACACGRGERTALRFLEQRYLASVPAAVAHMKLPTATVDEVTQQVRDKLLVATPGEAPKIAAYAGQGKLRGLIQLVAVRSAISLLRKYKREQPSAGEDFAQMAAAGDDPELGYLKARYRDEFRTAFAESVPELSARERNLLRLHLLRGVTLAALASMYSVHRATVTRWLARAREQLFSATKRRMRKRLDVDGDEFDSVMRLIESRLDVSVQRLFATMADEDGAG